MSLQPRLTLVRGTYSDTGYGLPTELGFFAPPRPLLEYFTMSTYTPVRIITHSPCKTTLSSNSKLKDPVPLTVYFIPPSVAQNILCRMIGLLANYTLERMWTEAVLA